MALWRRRNETVWTDIESKNGGLFEQDAVCGTAATDCTAVQLTLFPSYPHSDISPRMNLPHWVEQEINMLPAEFTGRLTITIECWTGGVTNLDINKRTAAPKSAEPVRHTLARA